MHPFELFPWLESLGKLLLGLWKGFCYSRKTCHVLKELQEPYGLKALNLVKVGVKWCLSHGAACQRCWERYIIIIEALHNIVSKKKGIPNLNSSNYPIPNHIFIRCPQCDKCSLTPSIWHKGFCSHFRHYQLHITNTGRYW